jgi:hypothetical protein
MAEGHGLFAAHAGGPTAKLQDLPVDSEMFWKSWLASSLLSGNHLRIIQWDVLALA